MDDEQERPLTAEDVGRYFKEFMERLQRSARVARLASDMEISDYVGAMYMFDTYYDQLMQSYYDSIEFIESMARSKGTRLESEITPRYVKTWILLKEIPLVKQRWRRRKVPC